ncbi:GTP-binding protein [Frigoribacterium sp. 2-23]|uniref:GTP-binding protein n=1 Tax=Frigoribacterium sp. 2-23 TaxID=3415006 RepID=UPI003C6F93A8
MAPSSVDRPGPLTVTLVGGSSLAENARIAGLLSGRPPHETPRTVDEPQADSAELALEVFHDLLAAVDAGAGGHTVVALDPEADVAEFALVLEHLAESQRPVAPIVILDVVAVTSVDEIGRLLFGRSRRGGPVIDDIGVDDTGVGDVGDSGRLASRLEFSSIVALTDLPAPADPTDPAGRLARIHRRAPTVPPASARRLPPDDIRQVGDLLARLAPASTVVDERALRLLNGRRSTPGRGLAHRLGSSMGWQLQLGDHRPRDLSGNVVDTYVFTDPRPFHPGRLLDAVTDGLVPSRVGRILRSRGFVRLATRPGAVGSWATAGDVLDLDPAGLTGWDVDSPLGQEIVFFGLGLDADALDRTLSSCLLTPAELLGGPMTWATYPDPFPAWPMPHHHHG